MSLLINKITRPSLTINWMSSKLKIHPSLFYVAGAIGILSVFQPSLGQFAMLFWLGSIVSHLAHGSLQIWAAQKYDVKTSSINLFGFGLYSQRGELSKHATQNFWLAAMGPISHILTFLSFAFWGGLMVLFELALPIHLNVLLELIYYNLIYALIQLLPHKSFDGHLMFKSIAEYKHIQKTLSINSFSVNLNKA